MGMRAANCGGDDGDSVDRGGVNGRTGSNNVDGGRINSDGSRRLGQWSDSDDSNDDGGRSGDSDMWAPDLFLLACNLLFASFCEYWPRHGMASGAATGRKTTWDLEATYPAKKGVAKKRGSVLYPTH
ncbi:unnamed protein product [Cuscuta campestris]|uniref:Uncharacterized protein n=1 Tax=Cuscuta campestris TaxID=132261 RepID=A0A484MR63_9ASTE|nr:unnamed protein product [Cuscuta campestris]